MFNQSNFLGALQTGGQRPIDLFVRRVPPQVRPAHPRLCKCALLRGAFRMVKSSDKFFLLYLGQPKVTQVTAILLLKIIIAVP